MADESPGAANGGPVQSNPEEDPGEPGRGWLVLVYRVPREPSRLRATVWRRLRAMGAVYLQSAVAALPWSPETERAMRLLRNEILELGGSA